MADMKCFNIVFNILFMILVEDAKICLEPAVVELQPLYEAVELSSFSTWDGMYQKSLLLSSEEEDKIVLTG